MLRMALAGNPDAGGIWRFTNNADWIIDPALLVQQGWQCDVVADDFIAAGHGALALGPDSLKSVRDGQTDPQLARAIIGAGTGLGLAYMIPLRDGHWHMHRTFGGHMLATAATVEQQDILVLIAEAKAGGHVVVPEDMVSGRGLMALYQACCAMSERPVDLQNPAALLSRADDPDVVRALRLFHEFFGLFAHHAIVTAHAYGGLYLAGGVVHALDRASLFDAASFLRGLDQNVVPTVRRQADRTPVWIVDDPNVALHGLARMTKEDSEA